MFYERKYKSHEFWSEPNEYAISIQSMKIGTHENKAIHSTVYNTGPFGKCKTYFAETAKPLAMDQWTWVLISFLPCDGKSSWFFFLL